jgi:RND family efflux transporter MFP subunit
MRRGLYIFLAIVVLVIAVTAYVLTAGSTQQVTTAEIVSGPAVDLVYATGFVEPEQPVLVSSRVTAPVRSVTVEEGRRVRAGQQLVLLDDAEQRGLLAQAEAELQRATLAEERIVTLFNQGWVTKTARDEVVAASKSARAAVAALKARQDQYVIRAGISGLVLKRDVYPGDLATPGKQLMQLGDPARARITATVDERDITRVRVGQEALMSTDGLPDKVIRGRVTEITPGGDPNQRAFRVRIGLADTADLPFGLTLEVNIVTGRRENTLLAPTGAVIDGKAWVVEDGKAVSGAVRTGIVGADKVEVLGGLAKGDRVIVNPPEGLEDGDKVRR